MTTERRNLYPPGQFLDWLKENYTQEQYNYWIASILQARATLGPVWRDDPVYQYWGQWIKPSQPFRVDSIEGLGEASSPEELINAIDNLIDRGVIGKEDRDYYWSEHYNLAFSNYLDTLGISPEDKENLYQFTSREDLTSRINRLPLDEITKTSILASMLTEAGLKPPFGTTPEMMVREAGAEALVAQEQAQFERQGRARDLTQAMDLIYNNPFVQQDLPKYRELLNRQSEDFLERGNEEIFTTMGKLNQIAQERSASEGQRAESLLFGLEGQKLRPAYSQPMGEFRRRQDEIPPMPKALPIAKSFLEGTKLGEGTKLRRYIESEIPDIFEKTRGARHEWWKEMHPDEPESFEDEQSRLQAEADKWARIAGSAPSSELAGGTYWGPGGLAGIASEAYKSAQEKLSGLRPEDYAKPWEVQKPEVTEDPFKLALKRKNFRAGYYRQPGAGLVRSLTPAVRW